MSLQISKREALIVQTNQAKCLFRAHTKIHYPRATKLPLVLNRDDPAPFTVQIIGAAEYTLSQINDVRAVEGGFKNRQEFLAHWNLGLYGKTGVDPSGSDRQSPDAKVVAYRFRRAEMVQKRLKVTA